MHTHSRFNAVILPLDTFGHKYKHPTHKNLSVNKLAWGCTILQTWCFVITLLDQHLLLQPSNEFIQLRASDVMPHPDVTYSLNGRTLLSFM